MGEIQALIGDVPRETVLGHKETPVEEWELPVERVLLEDEPGSQFSLQPGLVIHVASLGEHSRLDCVGGNTAIAVYVDFCD